MKNKRRAEWIKLCGAQAASGESVRSFAERHGVNWRTLGWWCSTLRRERVLCVEQSASFVEVVPEAQQRGPQSVVRVGAVAVEFADGLPPVAWLVELAARC